MADREPERPAKGRRRRAPALPDSVDPIEIAMADVNAGAPQGGPAQALLVNQNRLVQLQIRAQRLGLVLRGAASLAGVLLVAGLLWLAWTASRDRGLVIQSFVVPPQFARDGLRGEVVAGMLADRLAMIDAGAQSVRAPETFQIDWGDDVRIEIPNTGVSVGELDRYLRSRLGKQTRISGALYRRGDGVHLTVRAGGGAAVNVAGREEELETLVARGAEGVFERTQPYRYSKYLELAGRTAEALAVARRLATSGPPEERAWAWAQVNNLLYNSDLPAAVAAGRRSIALDPQLSLGHLNLAYAYSFLGRDEAVLRHARRTFELVDAGADQLSEQGIEALRSNENTVAALLGDYRRAMAINAGLSSDYYLGIYEEALPAFVAELHAVHHDVQASLRAAPGRSDGVFFRHSEANGGVVAPEYARAVALEDWPAAVRAASEGLAASRTGGYLNGVLAERWILPRLAEPLARTGAAAQAAAIVARLPRDCYLCMRMRGRTLAVLGDAAGADRALREAIRQAPSLPQAHRDAGQLLLARGRIDAAAAAFGTAHRKGPRWADPLKYWGDALTRQGKDREAIRKYAAAAERAPRWGALHIEWGKALWRAGERDEARAKLRAAAGMDLSAADRTRLRRLWAAANGRAI